MPVKSTTAVAPKKTPAKRKTRTRKTTTAQLVKEVQKSTVSPKVVATKYQQPKVIKVTETPTPAKVRPAKPNLTIAEYTADVKVRWEIHQWETQELWNDMVKGYDNVKPFVIQSVNYLKDSYDRAFNETSK